MTDHPLTDEMIDQIQMRHGGPCFECYPDLRAAYDKGDADRLEQVFEWLYNNLYVVEEDGSIRYLDTRNSYGELVAIDRHQIIDDLEAAMRPQEES